MKDVAETVQGLQTNREEDIVSWIQEIANPKARQWEEFYRNRWQHDRVVRSTHGVNCTGGCSWMVYVKDGIVTWEMQATDYPKIRANLPPYEPRGCQRGISFSWYMYSPMRVKYPYLRGALMDLWHSARSQHADPVEAWASIVEDEASRKVYRASARQGGIPPLHLGRSARDYRCIDDLHGKKTRSRPCSGLLTHPGYVDAEPCGRQPLSSTPGWGKPEFLRLVQRPAACFARGMGEQTDVAESADWFNAKYIATVGSNISTTRTPDVHFAAEARHGGAKLVVFSPDFCQTSKYADWWVPIHAGQDGAFWMAVNHVILKEFHHEQPTPFFLEYVKRYTDAPFLVVLDKVGEAYSPGRMLRAGQVSRTHDVEHADWKFLVWDRASDQARMPQGSIGFRWQKQKGQWNLEQKDGLKGDNIDPQLTFLENHDEVLPVTFTEFGEGKVFHRNVPVRMVETPEGRVPVATIYDLLMGQFGVGRGLSGDYPADYDDGSSYTPAWQERFTGVDRQTVIQFAREWASTAAKTEGQCMIIIGSGVNHWYHNNLIYRAGISTLMLTGCVGRNGGGLNHYVGQEKVGPISSWAALAFALDWSKSPRLQNCPSYHYVHSDQWRYDRKTLEQNIVPPHSDVQGWAQTLTQQHTMDTQVQAVRMGWLPFFPQFNLQLSRADTAGGTKRGKERG